MGAFLFYFLLLVCCGLLLWALRSLLIRLRLRSLQRHSAAPVRAADKSGVFLSAVDWASVRVLGRPVVGRCDARELEREARELAKADASGLHVSSSSSSCSSSSSSSPSSSSSSSSDDFWRRPYELLCEVANSSRELSVQGRRWLRAYLLRTLTLRLKLRAFASAPFEKTSVRAVFVSGPPRCGLSYVHTLLATDQTNFAHLTHDALCCPFAESDDADWMRQLNDMLADAPPELKTCLNGPSAKNAANKDRPDDSAILLQHSFVHPLLALALGPSRYRDWLFSPDTDLSPHYRDMETWFHVISIRHGLDLSKRLLLKSPFHATFFKSASSVFEKAEWILCHREPVRAVNSLLATVEAVSAFSNRTPVEKKDLLECVPKLVDQLVEGRKAGKALFADFDYKWILIDPTSALQRVYISFQWPYDAKIDGARRDLVRQKPPHVSPAKTRVSGKSSSNSDVEADVANIWGEYDKLWKAPAGGI